MRRGLTLAFLACMALAGAAAAARAQDAPPLRIGVLADMSGTTSDLGGRGSVVAAQLAVDDNGGAVLGRRVEIVPGDAQSKPDIAANLARQWFDTEGVQAIADIPNAAIAQAVQTVARDRKKITLISAAASVDLYGKGCSPTGFLWTYDTAALSRGTAQAVFDAQGRSWYLITADFSFAIQLQADTTAQIDKLGGKVVGATRVPQGTTDFSSALLQAQSSGAQVVGMALAGNDMVNAIKGAREFGLVQGGQKIAGMVLLSRQDSHLLQEP